MTRAAMTQGPWFVSGMRTTMDRQQWVRVLQESPERELAFIPYADSPDSLHREAYANAKAIAAVPDLVKALLAARTALDNSVQSWPTVEREVEEALTKAGVL